MINMYVDPETGLVARKIYSDEAIYRQELERVFARCWLFLGHESQIARPGNYFTNSMPSEHTQRQFYAY